MCIQQQTICKYIHLPASSRSHLTAQSTAGYSIMSTCLLHVSLLLHRHVYACWASYSVDIGICTDTTSNLSSTSVVLELVAGRLDCQPRPNSQQQTLQLFLSSFRRQQLYLTVNIASEMHFKAFQCIAQPNTALHDCILYLTQYL